MKKGRVRSKISVEVHAWSCGAGKQGRYTGEIFLVPLRYINMSPSNSGDRAGSNVARFGVPTALEGHLAA